MKGSGKSSRKDVYQKYLESSRSKTIEANSIQIKKDLLRLAEKFGTFPNFSFRMTTLVTM